MDSMTELQRYILIGVLSAVLVGVICWVFYLLDGKSKFVRWQERRKLVGHAVYMSDLMHEYADAGMHFALLEREIAVRIGTAPPEFIPALLKVVRTVGAAQQTLVGRAKELGIEHELLGEDPVPEPVAETVTQTPEPSVEPEPRKVGLRVVGSLAWDKDGQLVPK